ncbi:hypothetical protein GLOIN_2v1722358 [Rhizophagus irregularis DAOM 181602=DAOM 197198]|uniref:Uncharacterized protein n=1 Tax=Rhizophagus irregularis (strain DAOM 181602 / DAOM 197198 / MUCL 43194) TaxID=747089 RepID=A0A2P4P1Y7_RHIID|nr:hypothetical protein GLOIN_2v1722358 [Rhizophagus irregularis DAOM 181602=DAOM 197198]POG59382.1 hypothetical protein GLOIN_2v1722358 [Rhizophagus irregularis DAOM 181602=DAOM 197198]|eukprot:XP_025166248.1 hypothetical protein GLOIN_2v1722358 [Rhizophagus irregularis DAOM 181602=DAOM 197198]
MSTTTGNLKKCFLCFAIFYKNCLKKYKVVNIVFVYRRMCYHLTRIDSQRLDG